MENPSLRVTAVQAEHSLLKTTQAMNTDSGAIDESAGEQGFFDDEKLCFRTWDDNEYVWQSRKFQDRQVKRRTGKRKAQGIGGFKRIGNVYLGEEQTQDNDWWSEEDSVWWSKRKKGRKGFSKKKEQISGKRFLYFFFKIKVQTRSSSQTKERVKIRVEEEKKVHILNQDFLHQDRQVKKDMVILGSLTIGIRILLMILQVQLQEELLHCMARDILHGWRQFL